MAKAFRYALKHSLPILISYIPVALAYGVLMQNCGYNFVWTGACSIFVLAGSLQYLMVTFFAGGVSLLTVAIMSLLLNSRHIFYGLSFIEKFRTFGPWKYFLIYSLTDENYSLHCSHHFESDVNEKWAYVLTAFLSISYWIILSIIGALIGSMLPFNTTGIDFAMTALFVVLISFPLGYYCGRHKNGIGDNVIRIISLVALSMPQFWIGVLLLLLFGLKLGWVPISGWGSTIPEHIQSLILPAITGALGVCTLMIKNLRSNVVDVMDQDFVDFARSKGIPESRVRSRHIVKNALISTVTLLALRIVNLLGYTVVIETVFSLPGVGALLVEAIFRRDYAVVQSVVVIFAALVLLVNLITDISYSLLDPRVELE